MGRLASALRVVIAAACAAGASHGLAQKSIHLQPVGTLARGSFELNGRVVPLPEGEYFLAATSTSESTHVSGDWLRPKQKFVHAFMAQIEGGKLRSAVVVSTIIDHGSSSIHWTDEPCRRDDTLYRLNLAERSNQQNCLLVNHIVQSMGPKSTGVYAQAATLLASRGVELPVPTLVTAFITQIEAADWLSASYAFNPELWGCRSPGASWNASQWHRGNIGEHPDKGRFVEGVVQWGKHAQSELRAVLLGRGAGAPAPGRLVACNA